MDVLRTIKSQIRAASNDLLVYRPDSVDWNTRAVTAATRIIPWLIQIAPALKNYVQDVLNAPAMLRDMWTKLRPKVNVPKEDLEAFDRQLKLGDVLRESVTGELVSKVVAAYFLEHPPAQGLHSNGRSDYPDIYLASLDYAALPTFKRKRQEAAEDQYGAALKGKQKRPVRIPDGLEIKTCRERIAVDCHHPHAGLHFVLVFTEAARLFTVTDLRVAFLRRGDYRESQRNTTATTVKYSFNGDQFVSILGVE